MGEPKPIASLSGLLLARKGAARPAMRRPSVDGSMSNVATLQEDLGWNDMGYDVNPDQSVPMDHDHDLGRNPLANAVPEASSVVREQQQMIVRQLEAQAEVGFESVPVIAPPLAIVEKIEELETIQPVTTRIMPPPPSVVAEFPVRSEQPKKRAAPGSKGKAAFTLRLDTERHLKLRLACAVGNRSAQMIVTDALDAFLDSMPEIAQLAARVPTNK
jgi:hypothetical protein